MGMATTTTGGAEYAKRRVTRTRKLSSLQATRNGCSLLGSRDTGSGEPVRAPYLDVMPSAMSLRLMARSRSGCSSYSSPSGVACAHIRSSYSSPTGGAEAAAAIARRTPEDGRGEGGCSAFSSSAAPTNPRPIVTARWRLEMVSAVR